MSKLYLILLILYFVIPIVLIKKKLKDYLNIWVVQGIFIDILAVKYFGNISSFKIVGLILLPINLPDIINFMKFNKNGKILAIFLVLMISTYICTGLNLYYSGNLNFKLILNGFKQLMTFASEISIGMYIAKEYATNKTSIIRAVKISAFISVIGIFLEKILNIDFYHYMTNDVRRFLEHRKRGFAFEPRAASQHMTYIILGIIGLSKNKITKKLLLLTPYLIAYYFSISMTGILLIIIGLSILFVLKIAESGLNLKKLIIYSFCTTLISLCLIKFSPTHIKNQIIERNYIFNATNIAERFEPAESTVVNYLMLNKEKILFGIGTGLMGSITKEYTLNKWKGDWPNGVSYQPFMGAILVLANVGLVGLILIILFYLVGICESWNKKDFFLLKILCVTAILYFFQVRYFHVFALAVIFHTYLTGPLYKPVENSKILI